MGWLYRVAKSYLADRKNHWAALKRKPSRLLRLTEGDVAASQDAVSPADPADGPVTLASRREQLALVVKALAVLMPRDRDLVRWSSEGLTTAEQAERLRISRVAAERARRRALERFRKAYRILARAR